MMYECGMFKTVITKPIMGSSGAELVFRKRWVIHHWNSKEFSWIAEKWQESNQLIYKAASLKGDIESPLSGFAFMFGYIQS